MSADAERDEATEALLEVFRRCRVIAEGLYDTLAATEVGTGVVGSAKLLVRKLDSTIALYERSAPWSNDERLAINAWRIACSVADPDAPMLPMEDWSTLDEDEKTKWRLAALRFKAGEQ